MTTTVAPRNVRIDVTSDVNCPFCLIGAKQLTTAVDVYNQSHPNTPIKPEIRFHPFSLAPHLPTEPGPKRDYLAKKFGADRVAALQKAMKERFAEVGYPDANTSGQLSSSHLAHRLQQYVLQVNPEKQIDVVFDVFELHHIKGGHASDRDALAAIAVKHGIFGTQAEALKWLDSSESDLDVKKGYAVAQSLGITGVPFFVFEKRWAASGAMGTEAFVNLLEDISQRVTGDTGEEIQATGTRGVQCL